MEKMYAISKGSYSDYRVLAVCDSKKTAKALAARYNATEHYSETYVETILYVDNPDVQRVETLDLSITIWDDGSETDDHISYRVEWPFDPLYDSSDCTWRWVRAPVHKGKGGRLDVYGTDHERVRKVFGERRALLHTDDAFRSKKEVRG